jgi:hypothetical protein
MERGIARKSNNFRPKRADVLWHNRKQDVLNEIGIILGIDEVTTATPGWFEQRSLATKNIIEKMSKDELEDLDEMVSSIAEKGYDEKIQRR